MQLLSDSGDKVHLNESQVFDLNVNKINQELKLTWKAENEKGKEVREYRRAKNLKKKPRPGVQFNQIKTKEAIGVSDELETGHLLKRKQNESSELFIV